MNEDPDARAAEIARLYAEGLTQRQIGQLLGIRPGSVCDLMKRYGIPARPKTAPHYGRRKPPDARVAEIERLYAEGLSQREIGQLLGLKKQTVGWLMHRYGIAPRPRGGVTGPANGAWKGEAASYAACHDRVRSRRGTPQHCERCGTTDPDNVYDWANLTGSYADPDDYARMCRSCHRQYDNARKKAGTNLGKADWAATSCP